MQINNVIDLDTAIAEMEKKKVIQEAILKNQYQQTIEHYKPKNLIKSAFKNALEPGETGNTILKTVGGLGAGLLAKNLVFGGPATSLIGKLASSALKVTATNTVLNNKDKIAAWGISIYKNLFTKSKKTDSSKLVDSKKY
jgi:hypothetical protein